LTKLPLRRKAITSKWVFKTKLDCIGHIRTCKSRLIARGLPQCYGEDYDHAFAPALKHETFYVLYIVSAYQGLEVRHFNVKSTFLIGELEEDLYMEHPLGFIEKR
jgi:hypothetical protein